MLLYRSDDVVGDNFQYIKSDGLSQWSALTSDNNVAFLDPKTWRNVTSNVRVSFLKSIVFFNIMKIISPHNNCIFHFCGDDHSPRVIMRKCCRSRTYLMILPLMVQVEVKGHFLSTYLFYLAFSGVLKPSPTFLKYLYGLVFLSLSSLLVFKKIASYY